MPFLFVGELEMFNLSNVDKNQVHLLNPLVLAYIGDAVYELNIRTKVIDKGNIKTSNMHRRSIEYVRAKSQAEAIDRIMEKLTEVELDLVRRARNTHSLTVPKNADLEDYKKATALEALIGYLYLKEDYNRVQEIIDWCIE